MYLLSFVVDSIPVDESTIIHLKLNCMKQSQKPKKEDKAIPYDTPHILGGHAEELVDHYWGSINYVSSLIRASEIKAGLILSFYGILLNFVYQNLELAIAHAATFQLLYVLLTCAGQALSHLAFASVSVFYLKTNIRKKLSKKGQITANHGKPSSLSR